MSLSALPPRDSDAVLTLHAHYFSAAELMFENYKRLRARWDQRGRLGQNSRVQFSIYFCTWLGFLGVTAEGFKSLSVRRLILEARPESFAELVPAVDDLGKLLKMHDDALRKFRNNVFHLREDPDQIQRFFREQPSRLDWAEELQSAFSQFFSSYRVLCQVQYAIEGRRDELFR